MMKTGVLLMAHGSPERPEDVAEYLRRVMQGRLPSPELVADVQSRYKRIGGRSPLLEITREQGKALEQRLGLPVAIGMRVWKPFLEEAIQGMAESGVRRVVGLCAAPHYSMYSVGRYFAALEAALPAGVTLVPVRSWGDEPALWESWVERIRGALEPGKTLVFTAHSVPGPAGDDYTREVEATARGIAGLLGNPPWELAYQSRSPGPGAWHEPDVDAKIEELAGRGVRDVLVVPIGFLCDHVEVLYDLDVVHRGRAEARGMAFARCPMPNASPLVAEAMAAVVRRALGS